jgi:hypothetical protein
MSISMVVVARRRRRCVSKKFSESLMSEIGDLELFPDATPTVFLDVTSLR